MYNVDGKTETCRGVCAYGVILPEQKRYSIASVAQEKTRGVPTMS